jgi:hypothetical protein
MVPLNLLMVVQKWSLQMVRTRMNILGRVTWSDNIVCLENYAAVIMRMDVDMIFYSGGGLCRHGLLSGSESLQFL